MFIGIFGWIICGVVFGFIFSKLVNLHGDDPRLGIAIAAVSSIVGGWLYPLISGSPVSHFNLRSLLCAMLAALVVVSIWHLIRARSPHEQQTVRRSY